MSQLQPVFFTCNTSRKEGFLIETRIYKKDNTLSVEKKAPNPKSIDHLEHMIHTYQVLSDIKDFISQVDIAAPTKTKSGSLIFEYINGLSVERVLLERILSGDEAGAFDIIDKLFTLIDSLPSNEVNPSKKEKYVKVFGNSYNKNLDCTKIGIIDLNLDNIIASKDDRWHLFDYEWLFEFPVPKSYLRTRFMWVFLYRHREILRYHAQRIKSFSIDKGTAYIPKFLYNRYKETFEMFEDFCIADSNFQIHVKGRGDSILTKIANKGLMITDVADTPVGFESFLSTYAARETAKISNELDIERREKANLKNKINTITASRSYKLAKKLGSLKRKLTLRR